MSKAKDVINPVEEEKEIKVAKAAKKPKEEKKAKEPKAAKVPKETKATKSLVPEVFIQLASNEVAINPTLDKVKAEWVAAGHKESSIKTLNLYVKPEENAAYYVINEKHTGKVDL